MYINSINGQAANYLCPSCRREQCKILVISNKDMSPQLVVICSNCSYKRDLPSPVLNKKVIYLDQCCIDNIGKARAGKTFAHSENFKNIANYLERLVKKQLIVCSSSNFHNAETSYIPNDKHRNNTQKNISLY